MISGGTEAQRTFIREALAGFERRTAHDRRSWVEEIRLVSSAELAAVPSPYGPGAVALATQGDGARAIWLPDDEPEEILEEYLIHELCHHVDWRAPVPAAERAWPVLPVMAEWFLGSEEDARGELFALLCETGVAGLQRMAGPAASCVEPGVGAAAAEILEEVYEASPRSAGPPVRPWSVPIHGSYVTASAGAIWLDASGVDAGARTAPTPSESLGTPIRYRVHTATGALTEVARHVGRWSLAIAGESSPHVPRRSVWSTTPWTLPDDTPVAVHSLGHLWGGGVTVLEIDGELVDGCLPVASSSFLSYEEAVLIGVAEGPLMVHGVDLGAVLDEQVGAGWRRPFPPW